MAEEPEPDAVVTAQEVVPAVVVVAAEEVGTLVASVVSVGEEDMKSSISSDCSGDIGSASCAVAETGNEAALGCNAETLCQPHSVLFTELPDLVIEAVLKQLDISSLLSLRLTCQQTKVWVDTIHSTSTKSPFLSNFHINVTSNDDMVKLLTYSKTFPTHANPKWRCVSFPEKNFTGYPTFPSFVSTFSAYLTTLHIHHFNGGLAEILFLSSCESLEHLKIDEMDLRQNPTLVIASDKMLKAKCPKLLDIFTELKGLLIGIIYFNEVKQLSFYQTFLQRCKKLEVLNVPRPQGPQNISWETLKQIQLKSLIAPIREYLHKKPMTKPIKSDIQIMDVDGLFSKHFPVVAEACVQIGSVTKFVNVNEKHVKYLFTHEGNILQRIVSLKEKIDDRRHISKWDNLERLQVRSSRCDVRNLYPGEIAYPNLKYLSILMDSRSRDDPGFCMLGRLVELLVKVDRDKLTEFVMQWPLFSHDTPQDYVRARDFVGGFGNLTKLHVNGWTVPDEDFLLIWGILGRLKWVVLEECLNLTDWGFLGSKAEGLEKPAIFNLKDLTRLEIRNRNTKGYITDECFQRAFMHMRLKYFLVESFQVTIKGYEYLTEGEFSGTIQKLPCPHSLPRGIQTEEEFTVFVATHFQNVLL